VYNYGIASKRIDAKGSDARFPFTSRCGSRKGEAQCIYAGWRQEGHLARKTSHENPLFQGLPANPGLPGK